MLQIAADAVPVKIRYAAASAINASPIVNHSTLKNSRWTSDVRASVRRNERARTLVYRAAAISTSGTDHNAAAGIAFRSASAKTTVAKAEAIPQMTKNSPPAQSRGCDSAKMRSTI